MADKPTAPKHTAAYQAQRNAWAKAVAEESATAEPLIVEEGRKEHAVVKPKKEAPSA